MNEPRLIDANEWIKELRINPATNVLDRFVNERIICLLEKRPTAYDIDKVIKELIDHTQECTDRITYKTHSFVSLFDAIKIVKGNNNG